MSLYSAAKPPEPEVTGTSIIRLTCRQWARDGGLARLARDCNIGIAALDNFVYHGGGLAPEGKQALASVLFAGFGEYVPELDRLRSVKRAEPIPGGIPPEPYRRTGPPIDRTIRRLAPVEGAKPPPDPRKRPGWAE
jgi:hypothetical protein